MLNIFLLSAIEDGYQNITKLLIKLGASVNSQDQYETTALMSASNEGHAKIVELLIKKGADVNFKTKSGCTALMFASQKGHEKIVRFLIEAEADVSAQKANGWTALMFASQYGHKDVVELLLNAGVAVNTQNDELYNALMLASKHGRKDVVELLLNAGVAVNMKNQNGWTALMIATQHGHKDIVELLLNAGARINSRNKGRYNALIIATQYGREDIVELLIKKGADVTAQNSEGKMALDLTTNPKIKKMLKMPTIIALVESQIHGFTFKLTDGCKKLLEKHENFVKKEVSCFVKFNSQLFLHILDNSLNLGKALECDSELKFIYSQVSELISEEMGQICAMRAREFENRNHYQESGIDYFERSDDVDILHESIVNNKIGKIFKRIVKIMYSDNISLEDARFALYFIDYDYINAIKNLSEDMKSKIPHIIEETMELEKIKESYILAGINKFSSKKSINSAEEGMFR